MQRLRYRGAVYRQADMPYTNAEELAKFKIELHKAFKIHSMSNTMFNLKSSMGTIIGVHKNIGDVQPKPDVIALAVQTAINAWQPDQHVGQYEMTEHENYFTKRFFTRKFIVDATVTYSKRETVVKILVDKQYHDASAYPRAANTVYVGLSWESKQGVKTVVDKTVRGDQERWLVQTEGRSFAELFSTDDIISEMKRDAANLQSQNKWKQEADELEKQKAVLEETYGFYATMSSMMKAKAKLALEKQQGFSGTVMRRKDAVEQRVKDGWQVQTDRSGKRIFTSPSGSFYYEKDITKWAMDYAQYLIDNQIL